MSTTPSLLRNERGFVSGAEVAGLMYHYLTEKAGRLKVSGDNPRLLSTTFFARVELDDVRRILAVRYSGAVENGITEPAFCINLGPVTDEASGSDPIQPVLNDKNHPVQVLEFFDTDEGAFWILNVDWKPPASSPPHPLGKEETP